MQITSQLRVQKTIATALVALASVVALLCAVPSAHADTIAGQATDAIGDSADAPDLAGSSVSYDSNSGQATVRVDFAGPIGTPELTGKVLTVEITSGNSCPGFSGVRFEIDLAAPSTYVLKGLSATDPQGPVTVSADGKSLTITGRFYWIQGDRFNCSVSYVQSSGAPCACDGIAPFQLLSDVPSADDPSTGSYSFRSCTAGRDSKGISDIVATENMRCSLARSISKRWRKKCGRARKSVCSVRFSTSSTTSSFFSCARKRVRNQKGRKHYLVTCDNPQERRFLFNWSAR